MNNENMPTGFNNIPNPQAVPNAGFPSNQPMPNPQVVQQPYITPAQPEVVVNPMAAVSNLNKDEAMEEALSHTTQYSPFQAPVSEIKQEAKKADNKKAMIFIGIIVAIMAIFILLLPQISKMFGW